MRNIIIACLIVCAACALSLPASADDIHYAVRPLYPENQIDRGTGYYALRMEPGQQQTIELEVINRGDTPITVQVEALDAYTNTNGAIDYGIRPLEATDLRPFAFSDAVKVPSAQLTIPPGETASAFVKISMPQLAYDGIVQGGIRVSAIPNDAEAGSGFTIRNTLTYLIGMRLSVTDALVQPSFSIEAIQLSEDNQRLHLALGNQAGVVARPLSLNVSVDNASICQLQGLALAARSVMPCSISLAEPLPPGTYNISISIRYALSYWTSTDTLVVP